MTQAPKPSSQWRSPDSVPESLKTHLFVIEPLDEGHAEMDFQALMSCRERLREELEWGDWPPKNFALEDNRIDLRQHHDEFVRGEAFAYTVLDPDRMKCLGCIYVERCAEIDGAQLAYWVIDDAIDLEALLVREVLTWLHTLWAMGRVMLPFREANLRGLKIAQKFGLRVWRPVNGSTLSKHHCFLSVRTSWQSVENKTS